MAEGARCAIAYIRLTESRPAPGSIDEVTQRAAIEAWAAREGVEVKSWQIDVGVSGTTPIAERPGLMAAYRAIREHRAGILTAANADRFSRDELVAWLIERAALTEGATIRTADGSRAKGSPADAEQANVGFTRGAVRLARAYNRAVASSKIRTVLEEKRSRGERVGTIPYGYRLSTDGLHVEPDEGESAVVSLVHDLARGGHSHRAIVALLAERGITGRTGAPLKQTQVANILRSI